MMLHYFYIQHISFNTIILPFITFWRFDTSSCIRWIRKKKSISSKKKKSVWLKCPCTQMCFLFNYFQIWLFFIQREATFSSRNLTKISNVKKKIIVPFLNSLDHDVSLLYVDQIRLVFMYWLINLKLC